jgi:DNA-binding HxlR family transcriptional regulator
MQRETSCSFGFVMALKDSLNVISGKWKLAIVCVLLENEKRFNDIQRLIKGITPRMLSRELKELEINGVVRKISALENNLEVSKYALTESGQQLDQVIIQMVEWGQRHRIQQIPLATLSEPALVT